LFGGYREKKKTNTSDTCRESWCNLFPVVFERESATCDERFENHREKVAALYWRDPPE